MTPMRDATGSPLERDAAGATESRKPSVFVVWRDAYPDGH